MFADCPSCAQTYQISRAALGGSGRTVVCPACDARWYVAVPVAGDADPFTFRRDLARSVSATQAVRSGRRSFAGLTSAAICLAGLILASGLIAARASLVRALPRAAGVYAALGMPVNVRGLALGEIKVTWPSEGGPRVSISGHIRNLAAGSAAVPRLAFDLRDAKGTVLASWSSAPPRRTLAKGETVAFATETSALPEGARDVLVRFTDAGAERPLLAAAR